MERKRDSCVLLLLHALEPLKVDHKDSWGTEDLDLLDSLLVKLASTAEPSVLVGEFLRRHELPETVIDSDLVIVRQEGAGQPCRGSLGEGSGENLGPD